MTYTPTEMDIAQETIEVEWTHRLYTNGDMTTIILIDAIRNMYSFFIFTYILFIHLKSFFAYASVYAGHRGPKMILNIIDPIVRYLYAILYAVTSSGEEIFEMRTFVA